MQLLQMLQMLLILLELLELLNRPLFALFLSDDGQISVLFSGGVGSCLYPPWRRLVYFVVGDFGDLFIRALRDHLIDSFQLARLWRHDLLLFII